MFETRGIPFILLDIACLILAGLPLAAFNLGKIKPYQRGFFCNDESISYPFHTSTVTSTVLYTVGFTLPICSVSNPRYHRKDTLGMLLFINFFGKDVHQSTRGLSLSKQEHTKACRIARPPSLSDAFRASPALTPFVQHASPPSMPLSSGKGLSFYSGHSSFSMYCMLFLALYLQARMQTEWARLLRPMFQFFLIAASIYTGLSRVSDYKHHWSDVLTGLIQGAIVALLVVFCVSNFFKKNVEPQREAEIPHTTL
ncbi:phospholipid phosphatase 1-like [Sinocyclocheilus rhinocerous]|uniref:phospholipid phosphatase 1-like n=1 Tax=Sinocyclocheilus rhinocerous TaxID=307959 RepID=UPI0007B83BEF|nr:PREDICTED: phospholipid phosphatase 1-like [Sinocyclocheilus rhinocerous]